MTGLLTGRTAVVTGTAGGIGGAIAQMFVDEGAQVFGVDRHVGGPVECVAVDLAERGAAALVAAAAVEHLGDVDILVNCAGVGIAEFLADLTDEAYDRVIGVNLTTPVMLMKKLGIPMAERGYGRIVNITSIHGKFSEPTAISYDVSKGGLEAATRTVALELGAKGVLVNALAPGFTNTGMSIADGKNELESEWFRTVYVDHERLPLLRPAEPEEMACHVAWLCSDRNTYLTGQVITVDGGLTARF
jgi:NAD(P)-dependent dehydrogenase (short-subunit alcohol dehydrogenase family)